MDFNNIILNVSEFSSVLKKMNIKLFCPHSGTTEAIVCITGHVRKVLEK
jgi:hypothetical protein